jgi:7-cyano-7-deazaguanine synthase
MVLEAFRGNQSAAVLFSAGLDSAVLLADAARRYATVQPIYVSAGLAWEAGELAYAERLLAAPPYGERVPPLAALAVDMRDVYPASHWAVRGAAPAFDTPDEDVYIEGRNVVLLAKAAVYMARTNLTRVLLGQLAGNPFPDATPAFFDLMARALSMGLNAPMAIDVPFAGLHKAEVVRLGAELGVPFELTLSCMQPVDGLHCGRCSKCRERRDGFREAGVADPTSYAATPQR